jgi:hypothetical protein
MHTKVGEIEKGSRAGWVLIRSTPSTTWTPNWRKRGSADPKERMRMIYRIAGRQITARMIGDEEANCNLITSERRLVQADHGQVTDRKQLTRFFVGRRVSCSIA